ncbi:uncharacterized protein LOC110032050 isoform X2 [Phalaenopsis equestris]|uniref:uncharacterized protein LOC110032050 isoform X2 n=1 Tax=Phalaenopsis equestris TaxID=78828 RepID=UPI0009E33EFC|nr:uncharacterized protein LOC110032050 isoform X2 [Phalaenopsis equestris]
MGHRRLRTTPPCLLRRRLPFLLLALFSTFIFLASFHICASALRCANELGRRCLPNSSAADISTSATNRTLKIAMVSLSEEESGDGERRRSRRRSFRGVMAAVGGNKRAYAARMGYEFIDAHYAVDRSRPPSWSKILAVRSQIKSHDWVFWNDADTVVTNPDISLENILRAVIGHADFESSPDFVATEDVNGINAGVYSRGDFMVHLAGLDDKKEWAARIVQEVESERRDYVYLARQRPLHTL